MHALDEQRWRSAQAKLTAGRPLTITDAEFEVLTTFGSPAMLKIYTAACEKALNPPAPPPPKAPPAPAPRPMTLATMRAAFETLIENFGKGLRVRDERIQALEHRVAVLEAGHRQVNAEVHGLLTAPVQWLDVQ